MAVVVFGSVNMDLVAGAGRLPRPGETVQGRTFRTTAGGKGANQAVAAARAAGRTRPPVRMFGRAGDDAFGRSLVSSMAAAGVDSSGVLFEAGAPTGVALIVVGEHGENQIVVVPGANGRVGVEDVHRMAPALDADTVLMLQFEVPADAVLAAARAARAAGARVVLDPAPARSGIPDELLALADVITPNEIEAAAMAGNVAGSAADPVAGSAADILVGSGVMAAVTALRARGARAVVVTLGGRGAVIADGRGTRHVPAFPIEAVDTVAAGDAFNGALAVALDEGCDLDAAVLRGTAAGALAATRAGAQESLPAREDIARLLATDARR